MRNKIIAVGLAAAALLAVACGAKPTVTRQDGKPAANATGNASLGEADGPKRFNVGETANVDRAGGVADIVVTSIKAQSGKYLVASVTITCKSGTVSYNMFDWSMLAGDGTKLDRGFAPEVKNELASGDLGPGQKVIGNLVFQGTAAQLEGAQAMYEVGTGTVAYWVSP